MPFVFASNGEKHISVTVKDWPTGTVIGTASGTLSVLDFGSCNHQGYEWFFVESANAFGVGSVHIAHQMEIANPSPLPLVFYGWWLPRGADNSSPLSSNAVLVQPHSAIRFENVLQDLFNLDPDVAGAIAVMIDERALSSSLIVDQDVTGWGSRVAPHTYTTEGLSQYEIGYILHLVENNVLRSNLYCANMTYDSVRIYIELYNKFGTFLQSRNMDLPPLGNNQFNQIFSDFAPVNGYVRVYSSKAGSYFSCNGIVLPNFHDDARNEPMHTPPGWASTYTIPRAEHNGMSTTDLSLFSPLGVGATARIDLLPSGLDNTSYVSVTVPVPGGQEVRFPAVLDSVFGHTGTAALRVVATSGSLAASAAHIGTPNGSGPVRSVQVLPSDVHTTSAGIAALIHLTENVDFRTDIGVTNTSGSTLTIEIDLRDASDTPLGTRILSVLPFSNAEISGVFSSVGHPVVSDGMARVRTTTAGGSFFAYAIVTNLHHFDSVEFPSQRFPIEIFADGFESDGTTQWSASVP